MLRTLGFGTVLMLVMVAVTAGTWLPGVGGFFHEVAPVAAFCVYFGFGFSRGEKTEGLPGSTKGIVLCSLIALTAIYSAPYIAEYYRSPVKLAEAMSKERGTVVTYAEAAAALDLFVGKETGVHGIPGFAIYSERSSLTASSLGEYASHQFDDVDDLGGILAALLNIVLFTIPIGVKWLLCDTWKVVHEPGYVGLVFWYLAAIGFFTVGFVSGSD
jgi:hypothetical protein